MRRSAFLLSTEPVSPALPVWNFIGCQVHVIVAKVPGRWWLRKACLFDHLCLPRRHDPRSDGDVFGWPGFAARPACLGCTPWFVDRHAHVRIGTVPWRRVGVVRENALRWTHLLWDGPMPGKAVAPRALETLDAAPFIHIRQNVTESTGNAQLDK